MVTLAYGGTGDGADGECDDGSDGGRRREVGGVVSDEDVDVESFCF